MPFNLVEREIVVTGKQGEVVEWKVCSNCSWNKEWPLTGLECLEGILRGGEFGFFNSRRVSEAKEGRTHQAENCSYKSKEGGKTRSEPGQGEDPSAYIPPLQRERLYCDPARESGSTP